MNVLCTFCHMYKTRVCVCVFKCFTASINESNAFTVYAAVTACCLTPCMLIFLFGVISFLFGVKLQSYQEHIPSVIIFNLSTFVLRTADCIHRDAYALYLNNIYS